MLSKSQPVSADARNNYGDMLAKTHDFDAHHVHCSNCRNAVIRPIINGELQTFCAKNQGRGEGGKGQFFGNLLRAAHAYAFKAADKCPEFRCMTDNCSKHTGA